MTRIPVPPVTPERILVLPWQKKTGLDSWVPHFQAQILQWCHLPILPPVLPLHHSSDPSASLAFYSLFGDDAMSRWQIFRCGPVDETPRPVFPFLLSAAPFPRSSAPRPFPPGRTVTPPVSLLTSKHLPDNPFYFLAESPAVL